MSEPEPSAWRTRAVVVLDILVLLYGLWGVILFVKSPYLGISGTFSRGGYGIQDLVDPNSSEPLSGGTHVTAVNGTPVQE